MSRIAGRGRSAAVAWCALWLVSSGVSAETLEEAWRMALGRDAALAAAALDARAATENLHAARGARWPSLSAEGRYLRVNEAPAFDITTPTLSFRSPPMFDDDDLVMGSVQARLPLYAGGRIAAGVRAARAGAAAAAAGERQAVATLKLDVARAYVDVLRAGRALRAAESSVESLAAHVGDVTARVDQEVVPQSNLLAARVALANAEQARLRARNAVDLAWAAYNRLLAEPLDRRVALEPGAVATTAAAGLASQPIAALVRQAQESREEIRVLEESGRSLDAQARAEIGRLLPHLALIGGYSHLENEILNRQDFSMVGVGVQWNLFDGGQTRHRAAALRHAGRAAAERARDQRSFVELEVRRARLDLDEAEARIGAAHAVVAQAAENLRMVREQYEVGLAGNTEVLDAVSLESIAVAAQDDAASDAILAGLRLQFAIGAL